MTFSDWFKRKKPEAPKVEGHRGIAAEDLQNPNLTAYQERLAKGKEKIPSDEVEAFLQGVEPLFVLSSNVGMVQYHPEDQKLMVEFLSGGAYLYSNVSLNEARSFATAQSKGGWVWDHLRVRGSKTAHRKPFVKIK